MNEQVAARRESVMANLFNVRDDLDCLLADLNSVAALRLRLADAEDRIADTDRRGAERGWDEGYVAAVRDTGIGCIQSKPNPYRADQIAQGHK